MTDDDGRLDYAAADPATFRALFAAENHLLGLGLDPVLVELAKLRASQVNGCSFCVDNHWKKLRALGVAEQKAALVSAWRDSHLFDPRERALLAWTESLTSIAQSHAADDAYAAMRALFEDAEIARFSAVIGMINLWNRLSIAFRTQHP